MSDAKSSSRPVVSWDTTWPPLKELMDLYIVGRHAEVSYPKFMEAYNAVYNYCTASRIMRSAPSVSIGSDHQNDTLPLSPGRELYDKIMDYFAIRSSELLAQSKSLNDQALLSFYATEWDRYSAGAEHTKHCFSFFNRTWVVHERKTHKANVYPVHILYPTKVALIQWRDKMFYPLQHDNNRLVTALLRAIESTRNGKHVDLGPAKSTIDSLIAMDAVDNDETKTELEIYQQEFEAPFLTATEKYFDREFATLLQSLGKGESEEKHLPKTEAQIEHCLHSSTTKKVLEVWEGVLAREYEAALDGTN